LAGAVALALGGAGATIGVHYHASESEAEETLAMLERSVLAECCCAEFDD